jgi:predicted O-methyltransferase YrrM
MAGNRLPLSSVRFIPLASVDMLLRSQGKRRVQPWISYRAAVEIGRLLRPEWRVLEFGAGMSTVWFAEKVSFVLTIEANREWHDWVRKQLEARALANVEVRLRQEPGAYASAVTRDDGPFDFALIDGDWRSQCVEPSLRALRPGGFVYIDNVDGPGRDAAQLLRTKVPSLDFCLYTDLAPGVGAPTTGMSAHIL